MNRPLPAWVALASYVTVALLAGVAIGVVVAPMPRIVAICPAPGIA